MSGRRRVAVVTGGGGGIGAAVATELGRRGTHVVTVDPLVSLDGSEQLPPPEETTAGRIVAAGGSAQASGISVTDRDAVQALFDALVDEFGRVDAVVNVAGISRPTSFARGTEDDWASVLSVHLDGYRNVLDAALPHMASAGHGRVLGVTSGSGWRAADTGAYGCAKRAVASLTWQLGPSAPPGVTVNAMSPIAVTRMVTAALEKMRKATKGSSSTGGLSLGAMPQPEELGPMGAHLVADGLGWCQGKVIFVGGSEVAVIDEPRLIEVVQTDIPGSFGGLLEQATERVLAPAEAAQMSSGGGNPRLGSAFSESDGPTPSTDVGSCLLVTDRDDVGRPLAEALSRRGVTVTTVEADRIGPGFAAAAEVVTAAGPIDAVVVAVRAPRQSTGDEPWRRVLDDHADTASAILDDARWARAVADHAAASGTATRLVTLTDATTPGGRSRAQAAAHHSRSALGATERRVPACTVSVEADGPDDLTCTGELAAHLVCSPGAVELSGAELVAGSGWVGLRSHPRPTGSVSLAGPDVPPWFDDTLRGIVDRREAR